MVRPCYCNGAQISLSNGILCGSVWCKFVSVRSMGSGELAKSRCKQRRVCLLLIRVVILRGVLEVFGEISVGVRVAAGRHGGKWKELFCFILVFVFPLLMVACAWSWNGFLVRSFSFLFVCFGVNLGLEVCSFCLPVAVVCSLPFIYILLLSNRKHLFC